MNEKAQEQRACAAATADGDNPTRYQDNTQDVGSPPSDQAETNANKPPRTVKGFGWVCVIAAILSSIFLFALDNTVTANLQPSIVDTFHDVSRLPWISVAYLLGAASINLLWSVKPRHPWCLHYTFVRSSGWLLTKVPLTH